jgi:hypothetical protein
LNELIALVELMLIVELVDIFFSTGFALAIIALAELSLMIVLVVLPRILFT